MNLVIFIFQLIFLLLIAGSRFTWTLIIIVFVAGMLRFHAPPAAIIAFLAISLLWYNLRAHRGALGTGWVSLFRRLRRLSSRQSSEEFENLVFAILAKAAQVDGSIKRDEIDAIETAMKRLNVSEKRRSEIIIICRAQWRREQPLEELLQQFVREYGFDREACESLLDLMAEVLFADGKFTGKERAFLGAVLLSFGLDQEFERVLLHRYSRMAGGFGSGFEYGDDAGRQYQEQKPPEPEPAVEKPLSDYDLLGVTSRSTKDEIKRAFRKLAMKYHPDRTIGLSSEMQKAASNRFREINEAYERLLKKAA